MAIKKYAYLLLSFIVKFFILFFTISTSYILSEGSFDKISYFRFFFSMVTMIITVPLSYYIFNELKENVKNIYNILIVIVFVIIVLVFILAFLHLTLLDILGLDFFNQYIIYYYAIPILSVLSQLQIYIIHARKCISNIITIFLVFYFILFLIYSVFLLTSGFEAALKVLFLFFASINIILFYPLYLSFNGIDKNIDKDRIKNKFKTFLVPSFIETSFSATVPFISMNLIVTFIGFEYIGELNLVLLLFGIMQYAFSTYLLNLYAHADICDFSDKFLWQIMKVLLIIYTFLSISISFFIDILNLNTLPFGFIVLLLIGFFFQINILFFGLILKKMGKVKVTLKHNIYFSLIFIFTLLVSINFIGIWAYAVSYILSYFVSYIIVIKDVKYLLEYNRSKHLKIQITILVIFISLYYIKELFL